MKKKKYLPLYYKWMETGEIEQNGLCASLDFDTIEEVFDPEGKLGGYWGYDGRAIYGIEHNKYYLSYRELTREFTSLRQTIVLFLAAMNDEL